MTNIDKDKELQQQLYNQLEEEAKNAKPVILNFIDKTFRQHLKDKYKFETGGTNAVLGQPIELERRVDYLEAKTKYKYQTPRMVKRFR